MIPASHLICARCCVQGWTCASTGCEAVYDSFNLNVTAGTNNKQPVFDQISSYTKDANENGMESERFFMRFPPFNGPSSNPLEAPQDLPLKDQKFLQLCPG